MTTKSAIDELLDTVRAKEAPLERVRAVSDIKSALTAPLADLLLGAVAAARADGSTWADIAQAMGMSRQAARKKFPE